MGRLGHGPLHLFDSLPLSLPLPLLLLLLPLPPSLPLPLLLPLPLALALQPPRPSLHCLPCLRCYPQQS